MTFVTYEGNQLFYEQTDIYMLVPMPNLAFLQTSFFLSHHLQHLDNHFLDSKQTVSTCPVFGNISTQHIFFTSYP